MSIDIPAVAAALKGKRTVLFNVAAAVAGVLYGQDLVDAIQAFGLSSDQAIDALVAAYAAANVLLRAITNTPILRR